MTVTLSEHLPIRAKEASSFIWRAISKQPISLAHPKTSPLLPEYDSAGAMETASELEQDAAGSGDEEIIMRATTLLRQQTTELDQRLQDVIADVSDAEWNTRAAPNTNLIGFIYWHVARTQDVVVQALIRGEPQLITREPWAGMSGLPSGDNLGIGTGISLAQADAIALAANRDTLQAYAAAVFAMTCEWLETLTDDDLDHRPDCLENIAAIPAYQTSFWNRIAQAFAAMSIVEILGYYCIAHPYQHLAEIGLLTQLLRGEN